VAIGVFDGVHLGHQAIIKRAVREARQRKARAVVVTFEPHPCSVLERTNQPPILTGIDLKTELIEQLGADVLVIVRFTKEVAEQRPEEFVDTLLVQLLRAILVVVGKDFRFGTDATGDVDFLKEYGKRRAFEVISLSLVLANDRPISSTRIRRLLSQGDLEGARAILGRYPRITGLVVGGYGRGSKVLGFPTANIKTPDEGSVPGRGVYAGRVRLDSQKWYVCVIDIGTSPTFEEQSKKNEIHIHIPGLDVNLYGKEIEAEIQLRIRDEKHFPDEEALKRQIARDIDVAVKALA
jgi:riboflavin kinase/FMN adenylyltransferase